MDLSANISGVRYTPFLCADLRTYAIHDLVQAFSDSAFVLDVGYENKVAVSWWVSAKRTRSYPYARVYDTLSFAGKKITIILVVKDEGRRGDRDFLQWDTVSLMSLLGIYVIVAYYVDAERSPRYRHKITNQRFDMPYIRHVVDEILSYQSDALHWNLAHIANIGNLGQLALEHYGMVSKRLNVEMHSTATAERRIALISQGRQAFISLSRGLAKEAQRRESAMIQPKERVAGTKGNIIIRNYLGGYYYLTLDEVEVAGRDIHLIEAKHSSRSALPSTGDIKDALIKMILFTNLEDVEFEGESYNPIPTLKLTGSKPFNPDSLNRIRKQFWQSLIEREARANEFVVRTA